MFDSLPGRTQPKAHPAEQPVATLTHKLWVAFAKTGRPDGLPGLEPGPREPTDTTVHLIDGSGARQVEDPYRARLDFVEQHIKP
jgi:para-nitrobenzyl esterase